jgi:opacity protein-like surface antigen
MMSTRSTILTALALAAIPSAALAQDEADQGFYAGVNAGVAMLGDAHVTYYDAGGTFGGSGSTDTASGTFDVKSAATFGGVVGYDFGTIRADLEVNYSRHKIRSLTLNQLNGAPVTLSAADRQDVCDYLEADSCGGSGNTFNIGGSRIRELSAMGNLWLDLPISDRIVPYAGGGIGVGGFEVDGDGKAKFAWQLGAGAALKLSRHVWLTADYRHREVARTTVDWDATSGFMLGKLKTDSLTAGLRFRF